VTEPLASNVHAPDAQLQLLKFVVKFWAVEAECRLDDVGYAALKNVPKAATATRGEGMQTAGAAEGRAYMSKALPSSTACSVIDRPRYVLNWASQSAAPNFITKMDFRARVSVGCAIKKPSRRCALATSRSVTSSFVNGITLGEYGRG
jgi:hypothetical protein